MLSSYYLHYLPCALSAGSVTSRVVTPQTKTALVTEAALQVYGIRLADQIKELNTFQILKQNTYAYRLQEVYEERFLERRVTIYISIARDLYRQHENRVAEVILKLALDTLGICSPSSGKIAGLCELAKIRLQVTPDKMPSELSQARDLAEVAREQDKIDLDLTSLHVVPACELAKLYYLAGDKRAVQELLATAWHCAHAQQTRLPKFLENLRHIMEAQLFTKYDKEAQETLRLIHTTILSLKNSSLKDLHLLCTEEIVKFYDFKVGLDPSCGDIQTQWGLATQPARRDTLAHLAAQRKELKDHDDLQLSIYKALFRQADQEPFPENRVKFYILIAQELWLALGRESGHALPKAAELVLKFALDTLQTSGSVLGKIAGLCALAKIRLRFTVRCMPVELTQAQELAKSARKQDMYSTFTLVHLVPACELAKLYHMIGDREMIEEHIRAAWYCTNFFDEHRQRRLELFENLYHIIEARFFIGNHEKAQETLDYIAEQTPRDRDAALIALMFARREIMKLYQQISCGYIL